MRNLIFVLLGSETAFAKTRRFIALMLVCICAFWSFHNKMIEVSDGISTYFDKKCYYNDRCSFKETRLVINASGTLAREFIALVPAAVAIVTASPAYFMQYASFLVANYVITHVVKVTVAMERPDKSNKKSFPSGHMVSVISAAVFLHLKHGTLVALPFYVISVMVGYSRVISSKHTVIDVIGGAVLPILTVFILYSLLIFIGRKKSSV